MNSARRWLWVGSVALGVGLWALAGRASAAVDAPKAPGADIDMFDGIKNGDLDVKFIPRNSKEANVIIKNNTDQPLNVHVPDAFVGIPVLAQAAAGAGGAGRQRNQSSNNQNQGVGGGMGGMGGQQGGQNRGGGAFNVPPEKVVKIKVPVVCLEYGKEEPNAKVPYEIHPVDYFTTDARVAELCKLLGTGQLDQKAAQAAAWHLSNHMSWEELAKLQTFPKMPQYSKPYFTDDQIRNGMEITGQALKLAEAHKSTAPAPTSAPAASTTSASSAVN